MLWNSYLFIIFFLYLNTFQSPFESTFLVFPCNVCFCLSLCLLLWVFFFCLLFCAAFPWQEVVGYQNGEKVSSHASVSTDYETQRLCQHEQTEHVHRRVVGQLHPVILRGLHHSKEIHQCQRRIKGQFHHDDEDDVVPLDLTCMVFKSSL